MYGQQPYGQQMYEYEQQPQEMYTAYTYNNGQQAPYNNGQQAAMGRQAQQISSYNTVCNLALRPSSQLIFPPSNRHWPVVYFPDVDLLTLARRQLRLGYQKKVLEEWRNPDVRQVEKWTKEVRLMKEGTRESLCACTPR